MEQAETQLAITGNRVENAILELMDQKGGITNPSEALSKKLDIPIKAINAKIAQLKKANVISTKRSKNKDEFSYLKVINVSAGLLKKVSGNPKSVMNGNGNGAYVSNREKPILVVMDQDNVFYGERFHGKKVSFVKLKEYFRQFGAILAAEVYLPHHFDSKKNKTKIRFLADAGWSAILCPDSVKDKDQVDSLMMDRVRQVIYLFPQTEVFIISRDSDFMRLIEINKDRGIHTIKLVNPFEIPEVLGYTKQELVTVLSRPVHSIMTSAQMLTPEVLADETDEQILIRHTLCWLQTHNEVVVYDNYYSFTTKIKSHLKKMANEQLKEFPKFHDQVSTALKEMGLLLELGNATGYKLKVVKNHPLFSTAVPQEWSQSVAA